MTPDEARVARGVRLERLRAEQRACAFDFLVHGDERGSHAKRCVYRGTSTPVHSREYDPGPPPDDIRLYEGTHLGALWGLNTMDAWQTAGWNIRVRRSA